MKYLSRILIPAAALIVTSGSSLWAADTVELKQQWLVGKKYYQKTQTTQTSEIAIQGQKIEQSVSTTMELSQAVRQHENGKDKRLTLRYDRVAMDMSMAGQKISFDSSKPGEGNDPIGLGKSLGKIAEKELHILLNDKDQITALENYDEFVKDLGASGVPGMDMSKMFNKEAVSQMMKGTALQTMPGRPIKVGDSWPFSSEIELPQLGKVSVKGNYTLKSIGAHDGVNCAEIASDATIGLDFGGDPAKQGASGLSQLGMKVEGGSLKGTIWFDPKLGFTRDAQLQQEMTMTMKNPADPSATLSVPIKQTISAKLEKVEDVK